MPPPTITELRRQTTRALNVRDPWARAFFEEHVGARKDVENRSYHFATMAPDDWCFIIQSRNWATRDEIRSLKEHRLAAGQPAGSYRRDHSSHGAIVGIVKFAGSFDEDTMPQSSVWYNGHQDKAWLISEAYGLKTPIKVGKGALCIRYFHRMSESGHVLAELAKELEP
jgi:hypothetical protein